MDRRTLIGGSAATAAAALLAAAPGPAPAAVPVPVVVFGDSFSEVSRDGFPNWVTQLANGDDITVVRNLAEGGATAATVGTNHFARQLRLWRAAGHPVGRRVIVFLGINDILHTDTFDASFAGYGRGLAELKAAGARLLLVEPLDLGRTPGYAGGPASAAVTARTRTWNRFVRGRGLPVVRLFDVFAPRLPDRSLFLNAIHLNRQGHAIVAGAVRAKLAP
jgi:lysophospholipase L1-like esterase